MFNLNRVQFFEKSDLYHLFASFNSSMQVVLTFNYSTQNYAECEQNLSNNNSRKTGIHVVNNIKEVLALRLKSVMRLPSLYSLHSAQAQFLHLQLVLQQLFQESFPLTDAQYPSSSSRQNLDRSHRLLVASTAQHCHQSHVMPHYRICNEIWSNFIQYSLNILSS